LAAQEDGAVSPDGTEASDDEQNHDATSATTRIPAPDADADDDATRPADGGGTDLHEPDAAPHEPDAAPDGGAPDAPPPRDAGHVDASSDAPSKKGFGQPCGSDVECATGFCEMAMMMLICTIPCHAGTIDPACTAAGSRSGECNHRGFCKQ
jgi:hypothetical protein